MGDRGSVVLFSGGLDSTALAYHARAVWGDPVHLLSFEYGQRHLYELDIARKLARDFVRSESMSVAASLYDAFVEALARFEGDGGSHG